VEGERRLEFLSIAFSEDGRFCFHEVKLHKMRGAGLLMHVLLQGYAVGCHMSALKCERPKRRERCDLTLSLLNQAALSRHKTRFVEERSRDDCSQD